MGRKKQNVRARYPERRRQSSDRLAGVANQRAACRPDHFRRGANRLDDPGLIIDSLQRKQRAGGRPAVEDSGERREVQRAIRPERESLDSAGRKAPPLQNGGMLAGADKKQIERRRIPFTFQRWIKDKIGRFRGAAGKCHISRGCAEAARNCCAGVFENRLSMPAFGVDG